MHRPIVCLQRYKIYWINTSFQKLIDRKIIMKEQFLYLHTIRAVDPCFFGIINRRKTSTTNKQEEQSLSLLYWNIR